MKEYVISEIVAITKGRYSVDEFTELVGSNRILDSLDLVELCLRLEDYAQANGFEFDWTSENAMSRNRSMFRTVGALVDELESQRNNLKK